jgi:hypothetical protein
MLMTGDEFLESIRDGRRVYIGSEVVEDVTTHPAFRNAARTIAMIYNRKRAPENREVMTCEEDGATFSSYYLLPRTRADLMRRFETHRRIASWTHGLIGRSPDNFPSYISGLVMEPRSSTVSARVLATTSATITGKCDGTTCSPRIPSPTRRAGGERIQRSRHPKCRRPCAWSTRTPAASPSTG